MSHSIQVVARHDTPITSPCFGANGELFAICQNGDIYKYIGYYNASMGAGGGQGGPGGPNGDNGQDGADENGGGGGSGGASVEIWGNSSGQPLGLVFDSTNTAFVCDCAHQSIFRISRQDNDNGIGISIEPYVREYESQPFLGPNGIAIGRQSGLLFFTDSGPLGETSLQNAKGSVFSINPQTQLLIPLAYKCLAYPSGIALSPDEKIIYVAETNANRILRFIQSPGNGDIWHCSVFHQLSGRFGPTALAVSPSNGDLFVAHFEFSSANGGSVGMMGGEDGQGDVNAGVLAKDGRVLVIDPEGEVSAVMSVPGPEITGLCLTPDEKFLLITEGSGNSLYRHPLR